MINGKKLTIVLPAYNAGKTLEQTYREIPFDIVDNVILVDDCSQDDTLEVSQRLGIKYIIRHDENKGYGGNQKTCYDKAIEIGSDIVIMLHPDYQYTPLLLHSMSYLIANGVYQVVFASRILGRGALKGGMPLYKYVANRLLTFIQNILMHNKLTEYHTGYRAYATEALQAIPFHKCSDNFIFDNEIIAQLTNMDYEIAEITCPTRYFKEASSINLKNSIVYGLGVLKVSLLYFLHRTGIIRYGLLKMNNE